MNNWIDKERERGKESLSQYDTGYGARISIKNNHKEVLKIITEFVFMWHDLRERERERIDFR